MLFKNIFKTELLSQMSNNNKIELILNVFIKIVDIWGFITIYYPILDLLSDNYEYDKSSNHFEKVKLYENSSNLDEENKRNDLFIDSLITFCAIYLFNDYFWVESFLIWFNKREGIFNVFELNII
jgi:hypothetical protein